MSIAGIAAGMIAAHSLAGDSESNAARCRGKPKPAFPQSRIPSFAAGGFRGDVGEVDSDCARWLARSVGGRFSRFASEWQR